MILPPQTIEQAQDHRYAVWSGNSDGVDYREDKCAYEMFSSIYGRQCSRKNGYGPEEIYCKQHSRMVE